MNGLVSIIMPAYNAGNYIAEAIDSVIEQSYSNWELIIVDDGSNDNTIEVVEQYVTQDSRLSYLRQSNSKQGKTRNVGISASSGAYIAFMDADDLWLPDKLAHQLKLLNETSADLIFGRSYVIEDDVKTTRQTGEGLGLYQGDRAIDLLLYRNVVVISTVLVKREALIKVHNFGEDLRYQYCEDWHLWMNLAQAGFSMFSDERVVAYYRIHAKSASQVEKSDRIKFFYAYLDLLSRYPDVSKLKEETYRRAVGLIHNETHLDQLLVKDILTWLCEKNVIRYSFIYYSLFSLNTTIFRKLLINRIKSGKKMLLSK